MTPEQRAAEIRRLATQLHSAILAARGDGLSVYWGFVDPIGHPRIVHKTPMDETFSSASIFVTRAL